MVSVHGDSTPQAWLPDKQDQASCSVELGKVWFCACLSLEERKSRVDLTWEKVHGEGYWQVAEVSSEDWKHTSGGRAAHGGEEDNCLFQGMALEPEPRGLLRPMEGLHSPL